MPTEFQLSPVSSRLVLCTGTRFCSASAFCFPSRLVCSLDPYSNCLEPWQHIPHCSHKAGLGSPYPCHRKGSCFNPESLKNGCPNSSIITALPVYLNSTHLLSSTLRARFQGYHRQPKIDTIFLNVLGHYNVTVGTLPQPKVASWTAFLLYKATLFLAHLATSGSSALLPLSVDI